MPRPMSAFISPLPVVLGVVLGDAAGLPFAGAELALVDDAGILVAGGAERHGAGHRAILECALEAIGQVARLVAAGEAERDPIGVERAVDRTLELRRALMPGQRIAGLFGGQTG